MAKKLTAALPPDLDLPANFVVQLTAVSPSTGAVVSGVKVSNVAILADPSAIDDGGDVGTFVPTSPLWLPIPIDEQG